MPPSLYASDTSGLLSMKEMTAPFGKRKTPTELRLEQLKRHQTSQDAGPHELINAQGMVVKKGDPSISSRTLIDTRVPDIYPSVKPGERLRFHPLRSQKDKDASPISQNVTNMSQNLVSSIGRPDSITLFSRYKSNPPASNDATQADPQFTGGAQEDIPARGEEKFRGLIGCTFRDVRDISNSQALLKTESSIDMVEALKKLAPRKALGPFDPNMGPGLPMNFQNTAKPVSPSSTENDAATTSNLYNRGSSSIMSIQRENSQTWVPVEGGQVPLDLSLKVLARFTSQDSLHWCHRLSSNIQCEGVRQFTDTVGATRKESERPEPVASVGQSRDADKLGAAFWQSMHSWVHPQASLPPVVLSAIATAAGRGGDAENTFLSKRYRVWEEAFRSLYYTFRSGNCSFFYFTVQQFIAMFVGGGVGGRSQGSLTAYMTRSTRGVRHLLGEQDIKFSMPLSTSEEPTTTLEDLRDLSEFEKSNPGQTRLVHERGASDNSSQSLLCFEGNSDVHRLYDFLLNHRSLLSLPAATDVPVLYAPVAFDNASLIVPEVICKQMQRIDGLTKPQDSSVSPKGDGTPSDVTYTMDIKGSLLPPWVITRICTVLQKSQPTGFSVRFLTEPLTEGLNIAQKVCTDPTKPTNFKRFFSDLSGKADKLHNPDPTSEPKRASSGPTSEFSQSSGLGTAVVRELKCDGCAYMAVLAPLQLKTSY